MHPLRLLLLLLLPLLSSSTLLGINLGNTLEEPLERPFPHAAEERYLSAFAAASFSLVRIPVRWDNHTLQQPPYTVDPAWLQRVATVAGWAVQSNLSVVINSHDDRWLDLASDSAFEAALPRFLAIWRQVAAAFEGFSPLLSFEVFNEPHIMSLASLNSMQQAVHGIIRQLHPSRSVLVCGLSMEGPWWINSEAAQGLQLPALSDGSADPNLVLQLHDYSPFAFASPPISIFSWGTAADIAQLRGSFSNVTAWAAQRRPAPQPPLPVLLGEFAVSHLQPNSSARLLWYREYAEAARLAHFYGLVTWDDGGWFSIYNKTTLAWDTAVLAALAGP